MTHPLVEQLRFARSEWRRGLRGVSEGDGLRRLEPMNSIGWIVGHMAWHEQRYWLTRLADVTPEPTLNEVAASGGPMTTPSLKAMLKAWKVVTTAADPHLDALREASMLKSLPGSPPRQTGTAILRVIYHYWFHTGEILAIRQLMDHPNRPEYVGNIDDRAPYRGIVRPVTRPFVPQPVLDAAHARAAARTALDWTTADRLRDEIEAAGWRIVDRGTDFRLEPIHAPDVADEVGVRYGRSEAVPSRLEEPSNALISVILVATDQPDDLDRALAGLQRNAPTGTQVIVVADDPDPAQAERLPTPDGDAPRGPLSVEVVRTSARLGWAAALNMGLRRSIGEVVVFMDASVEAQGDILAPVASALDAEDVAVAGAFGLRSADLRRFEEVTSGDAAAIEAYLLAFRRADGAAAGPLDEGFRFYRNLDIWWSLALRDRGEGSPPRRAVVVPGLPLIRHEHRGWTSLPEGQRDRLSKRNFYRVLDRFRGRLDLAVA